MTQSCAPQGLLKDLVCGCKTHSCKQDRCCVANEPPCTDDYQCKGSLPGFDLDRGIDRFNKDVEKMWCTNPKTLEDPFSDSDSDTETYTVQ